MITTSHVNSAFDDDLKNINNKIAKLGALAEAQLADTLKSLGNKNEYAFQKIIDRDKKLDNLESELNTAVFEVLATWSPVARDLRSVMVADKIGSILERIGDYSKNMSRRSLVIIKEEGFDTLPVNIIGLGEQVQNLLHESLDAYMEVNVDKAMQIWESDIDVDRLYLSIFKEILGFMSDNPDDAKIFTHMVFISKNLERIGDYTTIIAKQTYFLANGEMPADDRPKANSIKT
tara:strand:+ start:3715 stop:4413 length:699 start_codon:yes stop_codon:yes gene_type:complete